MAIQEYNSLRAELEKEHQAKLDMLKNTEKVMKAKMNELLQLQLKDQHHTVEKLNSKLEEIKEFYE
jgi:predicted RNase H-like nuclease (RuvC/YqgF family)